MTKGKRLIEDLYDQILTSLFQIKDPSALYRILDMISKELEGQNLREPNP